MNIEGLRDRLATAGGKFDGHVTHGSLEEQMKIICEHFFQLEQPGMVYRNTGGTFLRRKGELL